MVVLSMSPGLSRLGKRNYHFECRPRCSGSVQVSRITPLNERKGRSTHRAAVVLKYSELDKLQQRIERCCFAQFVSRDHGTIRK